MSVTPTAEANPCDKWFAFASGCLVVICVLLAHPAVECAFDDDWSYTHIALSFAITGKLTYDGWAAPMLLFQAVWGGMLIHFLGFSFSLLRLSTLPFAAGCSTLTYMIGRKAGLNPSDSIFAAATLALSPLFVPLAASFMTDIYGCFFSLLCLYCGIRAIEQKNWQANTWLFSAVIVGLVGGANRQITWIAPLVVLAFAVVLSRSTDFRALALVLTFAALIIIWLMIVWHQRQPFAVSESIDAGLLHGLLGHLGLALTVLYFLALTLLMVALPVLLRLFALSTTTRWPDWLSIFVLAGIGMVGSGIASGRMLPPWIGNIVTPNGVLHSGRELLGTSSSTLPVGVRLAIGVAVTGCITQLLVCISERWRSRDQRYESSRRNVPVGIPQLAVFGALYFLLLTIQAHKGFWMITDRHVLPLVPVVAIVLLKYFPSDCRGLTWIGWCALGVYGCYAIATTHDYYAGLRARVAAYQNLEARGVPPNQINGGLELDAWTQLELEGHMNNPLVRFPSDGYKPLHLGYPFWLSDYTPAIRPKYFLSWSSVDGLVSSSGEVPFSFRTWLPPSPQKVLILTATPVDLAPRPMDPLSTGE